MPQKDDNGFQRQMKKKRTLTVGFLGTIAVRFKDFNAIVIDAETIFSFSFTLQWSEGTIDCTDRYEITFDQA